MVKFAPVWLFYCYRLHSLPLPKQNTREQNWETKLTTSEREHRRRKVIQFTPVQNSNTIYTPPRQVRKGSNPIQAIKEELNCYGVKKKKKKSTVIFSDELEMPC